MLRDAPDGGGVPTRVDRGVVAVAPIVMSFSLWGVLRIDWLRSLGSCAMIVSICFRSVATPESPMNWTDDGIR